MVLLSFTATCLKPALARVTRLATAGAFFTLLYSPSALGCHSSYPDWRKVADPAGYLFCSTVFHHLDAGGLGPEVSQAEQEHGHPCHLDCQPPGDGFLMGHMHGITLPDGGCNIRVVNACQLQPLPERGNRELPALPVPDRPGPGFRPLPGN